MADYNKEREKRRGESQVRYREKFKLCDGWEETGWKRGKNVSCEEKQSKWELIQGHVRWYALLRIFITTSNRKTLAITQDLEMKLFQESNMCVASSSPTLRSHLYPHCQEETPLWKSGIREVFHSCWTGHHLENRSNVRKNKTKKQNRGSLSCEGKEKDELKYEEHKQSEVGKRRSEGREKCNN